MFFLFDFCVCVLGVPPFVLVVTVPFSDVSVVCEVVFSLIRIVNLLSRRLSLQKTRSECGFGV